MLKFPQAKINLGLNIVRKREDGYHDIETIFYAIPLCDAIEIVESNTMRLDFGDCDRLCPPSDNLVTKAYDLLQEYSKNTLPPVEIILRKQIPSGAGLGGGSSDASMALIMLRELFDIKIDNEQLKLLSTRLGADCPFFIAPIPHFAQGIGETLTPISLDLSGRHLYLVLPDVHISTKEAYSSIIPQSPKYNLQEVIQAPITTWSDTIVNDFERGIFHKYPILPKIKEELYRQGALYASMSGSGSAMYAICDREIDLSSLAQEQVVKHFVL